MIFPDHIEAIDVHVHLSDEYSLQFKQRRNAQMAKHFGRERPPVPIDEMAEIYRSRNMMAVIMNSIDRTATGDTPMPNDYVAEVVRAHPDVFLGFGAIDPNEGKAAENEIRRCKEELGLAGIGELNPARQRFQPNDPRYAPLWQAASDAGLVVLFHGGYAASGSGTPGGMGIKLRYARPIYLDDVAADHPELTIICAHQSWPWEGEALAVAQHKGNVYLDLSGYAPKYLSEQVRRYVNSRIPDKVLFGTDWPGLTVDRWITEFDELGMKPEVRQKVLLDNAKRVFASAGPAA
jgi:predicted TIM-barrel fold metal-dependent hydrolase